jgi:putative DNA primase/helicase
LTPKKQEQQRDSEWGKLITSILMTNPSVILFDNIRQKLDNTPLTVVLTTSFWADRVLGSNNTVTVPNLATWIVTGNNLRLSDEIQRRSVRIRLEAKTERPNTRKDFKHKNIEQWAAEHRKELVWSCLTLIQNWIAKGKPLVSDGKELGSFENWSNVMEGILNTNGVKGFLENADDFYTISSEIQNDLTELVYAWYKKIRACASDEKGYVNPWAEVSAGELYEGFLNVIDGEITLDLGRGNAQSQKIQLGLLLKENRGRVFSVPLNDKNDVKVQLQLAGKKKRSQIWTLTPVEEKPKKSKNPPSTRRTDPIPETDPDRFPLNPS